MKGTDKILAFFRKNAAYIVLAFCVLAVGFSLTLIILNDNTIEENNVQIPPPIIEEDLGEDLPTGGEDVEDTIIPEPVVKVIDFSMPIEAPTAITEYTETLVFNKTLKRYSSHLATDFFAPEGTPVKAVYEGKIEKIDNSLLTGVSITIDHGDGLKTVYNSLESGDNLAVGQTVNKGEVIGYVSVNNRQESGYGAHLHFEVIEKGESIDPVKYLVIDEK